MSGQTLDVYVQFLSKSRLDGQGFDVDCTFIWFSWTLCGQTLYLD